MTPAAGYRRSTAAISAARPASHAAPVAAWARGVTMTAPAPWARAPASSPGRMPRSSTATGTTAKPMAAIRSNVTAWPGSSTMTRSAGVSQVASTRSMPSSAPLVTIRLAESIPSAASCSAARSRSRDATGASAYSRAGGRAGRAGRGGSSAGSGPPVMRSLVPAGALR